MFMIRNSAVTSGKNAERDRLAFPANDRQDLPSDSVRDGRFGENRRSKNLGGGGSSESRNPLTRTLDFAKPDFVAEPSDAPSRDVPRRLTIQRPRFQTPVASRSSRPLRGETEHARDARFSFLGIANPKESEIMFRVAREIEFCYGHRLLDYSGKCRHLHGHNGLAVIVLEGEDLDRRGMLVDFGEIKRHVQSWVDENLDHNMLLRRDDPLVETLKAQGERFFVMEANPTAENIARLIYEKAAEAGLPVVEVTLWETPRCQATFRR